MAATLTACNGDDDDDCEDDSLRQVVPVHAGQVEQQVMVGDDWGALPDSGGFGTHLADCGG